MLLPGSRAALALSVPLCTTLNDESIAERESERSSANCRRVSASSPGLARVGSLAAAARAAQATAEQQPIRAWPVPQPRGPLTAAARQPTRWGIRKLGVSTQADLVARALETSIPNPMP